MNDSLDELSACGVSVWLDDLSRELLAGGELQTLIRDRHVVGVTTNPAIFASALAKGGRYNGQLQALATAAASLEQAVFEITTDDVRAAADLLAPIFTSTHGLDGRVSIEADPRLAHDTEATIAAARKLAQVVDRPNVLVNIPATCEGLSAITATIATGISVNVTLIFSLQRYRDVIDAYLTGLERARRAGLPLSEIHSVASFFVSRVDKKVDARLDAIGSKRAIALKGKAALANAGLAYDLHRDTLSSSRWSALAEAGANPQRPLWASTGVNGPSYADTRYVDGLIVDGTVNTMPRETLDAFIDHGSVAGDTVTGSFGKAEADLAALSAIGIDFAQVTDELEREGLKKLEASWSDLSDTVEHELEMVGCHAPAGTHEVKASRADIRRAHSRRASPLARLRKWLLVSIALPLIYRLATRANTKSVQQGFLICVGRSSAWIVRMQRAVTRRAVDRWSRA